MDPFWLDACKNTALVSLGVLCLATLISLPLAWLVERSDLSGRAYIQRLFTLPYIVPSYLLAVAWITLANPDVGWLNLVITKFTGVPKFFNIYGIQGVILIEGTALSSILFLSLSAALKQMDPSLEEAARISGASNFQIFRFVTLPLIRQSFILGLISVFLATIASFGVPAMVGTPGRLFVLTTGIYSLFQNGTQEAFSRAIQISLLVSGFTLGLVFISRLFFKSKTLLASAKSSKPGRVELGRQKMPINFLVWLILAIFIILPMLAVVASSFQSDSSNFSIASLNLASWIRVLSLDDFRRCLMNSVLASAVSSLVILSAALLFSLASWKTLVRKSRTLKITLRVIEELSFALYSLPGTVLALLLIVVVRKLGLFSLADSLFLLSLAYSLKYFSLGISSLSPGTLMVHPSLIESAELCGAGGWKRLQKIWLPLLKNSLFASTLLVLMPALGELTMTKILASPSSQNLGVLIFELHDYADRASASVVACLLIASVCLLQLLVERISRQNA